MWNIFKFFFFWFWLGVGAVVLFWLFGLTTAPQVVTAPGESVPMTGSSVGMLLGFIVAFFMCIPAYFLARPEREESEYDPDAY